MRVGGTGGKGARLHEAPGLGAAILMVIPEGEAVIVTGATQSGDGYDWAPVEYGAAAGWVATVLLVRGDAGGSPSPAPAAPAATAPAPDPAPTAALAVGDHAAVSGTGGLSLRIRGDASLDAPVYAAAPAGAVLLVIARARADSRGATWYNVDYDGLQGWAVGDYLARTAAPLTARDAGPGPVAAAQPPPAAPSAPAPPQPAPEATTPHLSSPAAPPPMALSATADRGRAIADEALRHVGARYVWGGTTPAGWDCSGMVFYLYKQVAGVTLPRTTQQQFQVGAPVGLDAIQAGDIVFFADTGGHGITHNGIALGDGRFVHAASEGSGTIISSLSNLYWAKHFAGARRP